MKALRSVFQHCVAQGTGRTTTRQWSFNRARIYLFSCSILLVALPSLLTCKTLDAQGMQAQIPASEYDALADLYKATSGDSWFDNTGWLDPQARGWDGVQVSAGHVTSINLLDNNLSGPIPASLGNLSELQFLALSDNQLTGLIPTNLANLHQLQDLYLQFNQLSGTIPTNLANLSQLQTLDLWGNQLTGNIPPMLTNLSALTALLLCDNQLTGSIPANLASLSGLGVLRLDNNQLSGGIPTNLGNLSQLLYLYLNANNLVGPIPSTLGELSQLNGLDLSSNQLSGPIPASLGNLSQLQVLLDLSHNQLTGTIPSSLGNLSQVHHLYLDDNNLSGAIPASLGNLSLALVDLDLSMNQLRGDVPDFAGFTYVNINISSNYLNVAPGSQSLADINAMIATGNTVLYLPQKPPAVTLNSTQSGNMLTLAWITDNPAGLVLQSTTNLTPPTIWLTVTNVPLLISNQPTVTVPISKVNQFYRLHQ